LCRPCVVQEHLRPPARELNVAMDSDIERLWDVYTTTERVRIRPESLKALEAFIERFLSLEEQERISWARSFSLRAEAGNSDVPVRMPLFSRIIFPVLLAGIESGEPDSARCLASFSQLLYQAKECQERLAPELRTERGLLNLAVRQHPGDLRARERLVNVIASALEYSTHELPTGVVHEADGATIEQCDELVSDLEAFRSHLHITGQLPQYKDLIEECDFHFKTYRDYLKEGCPGHSYEQFFSRRRRSS
jgi:hypothetical protein